jgi:hypothetical protein
MPCLVSTKKCIPDCFVRREGMPCLYENIGNKKGLFGDEQTF